MLNERTLPRLFLLGLLALLAAAGWQWRNGPPLTTSLLELIPGGARDALQQRAEERMQEPLSRELLVMIGHPQVEQALALSKRIATDWQDSGLFKRVQWRLDTDIPAVRQQLLSGRLALLDDATRTQLINQPEAFVEQRLSTLFDTFGAFSLLPTEQDWLGLGAHVQAQQNPVGKLRLDLNSGALRTEADGQTWVLLRARSRSGAFDVALPPQIAAQVASARQLAAAEGAELVAASGLLHAAAGQTQAMREISLVGGGAALGVVLLLLLAFRHVRALLALAPVLAGLIAGSVACVALFGRMHIITLVLGGSLIGVAIDYPLHYLSKSWTLRPWNSWRAMRLTLPGLSLSLLTSCVGYLALASTPFPALTQIAVFSAAGLLGAYLCAVCLLPALLGRGEMNPWPPLLKLAEVLWQGRLRLLSRLSSRSLLLLLSLFIAGGLWQLELRNDLRQWVNPPTQLLEDAQRVASLSGYQPTSQFFLVQATDETQLLQRQAALATRLEPLLDNGQLQGYLALSQLLAPPAEQQHLRQALEQLPEHWQPLLDLGVPRAALQDELATLRALPDMDIETALAGPLGEPWRPLWLGAHEGNVAAMVSLQGLQNAASLDGLAEGLSGVQLVDRLGELNRLFAATQLRATELKLASCIVLVLLLWFAFGLRGALRAVALPLLATFAALACLGWLGQPLSLFGLFGLLLVSAIGVDYAILLYERVGGAAVSLLGTLLAALTAWLSFGLLALSQTPAVSHFGVTVSLGLLFSFLLAPWVGSNHLASEPAP